MTKHLYLILLLSAFTLSVFAQKTVEAISDRYEIDIPETPTVTTAPAKNENTAVATGSINFKKVRNLNTSAYAIIIGGKEYDEFSPVEYAINDKNLIKRMLIESFGMNKEHIIELENPTLKELNRWFGTERSAKGELHRTLEGQNASELWVFYSGHGGPNGTDPSDKAAYLIATDTDKEHVQTTAYHLPTLYKNLSNIPAQRVIVLLDACFSGMNLGYENSASITVEDPFAKPATVQMMQKGVVITAARLNQFANWDNEAQNGLFTYELCKRVSNPAELDFDGNKSITYNELYKALSGLNSGIPAISRKRFKKEQNPTIQGGLKDIPFIKLP